MKSWENSKFLCELTYDDWLRVAKEMFIDPVYRGSKKEKNARIMSPTTLPKTICLCLIFNILYYFQRC